MILFQVIGLLVCGSFAVSTALSMVRRRIGPFVGFAWLALWIAAGTAIAVPDTTVLVARVLGITRGADLVFYLAILGMIVGFFAFYMRLLRIEGEITSLTRFLALRQAEGTARRERAKADREKTGS